MEGVAGHQSKSLRNDSRVVKNENTKLLNLLKSSKIYFAFMEWLEGKLISLFRQVYHVECKDTGFSSPIPQPAKHEQRYCSALNQSIALKTSKPWILIKQYINKIYYIQSLTHALSHAPIPSDRV